MTYTKNIVNPYVRCFSASRNMITRIPTNSKTEKIIFHAPNILMKDPNMQKVRKFLTISVPTYRRVDQFSNLAESFLNRVSLKFPDQIVIKVFDNSDHKTANVKRAVCNGNIIYNINPENVGFAKNFIKCAYNNKRHLDRVFHEPLLNTWKYK